jgi:hypothetical protein
VDDLAVFLQVELISLAEYVVWSCIISLLVGFFFCRHVHRIEIDIVRAALDTQYIEVFYS